MSVFRIWYRRSEASRSSSGVFQLLRNKQGVLYFRWPHGEGRTAAVVTYHVYPTGEEYLRQIGIGEDDQLPADVAYEMRELGHLYTDRTTKRVPKPRRESPQTKTPRSKPKRHDPLIELDKAKVGKRRGLTVIGPNSVFRRIQLVDGSGDSAKFRLPAAGGFPTVESRSFPRRDARQAPGTQLADRAFREFLAELNRLGWRECGKGVKWYERVMTKEIE